MVDNQPFTPTVVGSNPYRSQQWNNRTTVSHQQMRSNVSCYPDRYPVDRYLTENSKKFEMVNIIDDDIWNPEPALKPEDEIILKKLREMLQSTADDLKLLSSELAKCREPEVLIKTIPTPLDEEFNEKVHIEEVVNAKFHGYKLVDKNTPQKSKETYPVQKTRQKEFNTIQPKVQNTGVQANMKTPKTSNFCKNFGITRTKIVEIKEGNNLNGDRERLKKSSPLAYNEIVYKYQEPIVTNADKKFLNVQEMPSINIRSELKKQQVLSLDILPETIVESEMASKKCNNAVISMQHDVLNRDQALTSIRNSSPTRIDQQPIRKISKMLPCESSESSDVASIENNIKIDKHKYKLTLQSSPKGFGRRIVSSEKNSKTKNKDVHKHIHLNEWRKKLNVVYGKAFPSKKLKETKNDLKKIQLHTACSARKANTKKNLNNSNYIPYSKLTLGGVAISDVEREISNHRRRKDMPLSPILDRIMSKQHSITIDKIINTEDKNEANRKSSPKTLTTSDENLLQEVLDVEKSISQTLTTCFNKKNNSSEKASSFSDKTIESNHENNSYVDDFEDEESDQFIELNQQGDSKKSYESDSENASNYQSKVSRGSDKLEQNVQNIRSAKTLNLSFKDTVDIHEYVHCVDTHDSATQSNTTYKISLKETQTSPRKDKTNLQPIHNDLWPSIVDPKDEVGKMFKIEKDFIKQLIFEEYGDLFEKTLAKQSTSKEALDEAKINIAATQKITQTSPARVKSVTTSPLKTKTRTTSPFALSVTVEQQTSPVEVICNETELRVEIGNEDDLAVSINLSSPRFSLRLPHTSSEVLSNLEVCQSPVNSKKIPKHDKLNHNKLRQRYSSSTSSVDAYNSSSDISSLGEIRLKRPIRKGKISSTSSSSLSSVISKYSSDLNSILPLRSEGEVSLNQNYQRNNKNIRSEGEISNQL